MYLGCRFYPFVYVEFSRIPLKKLAYIYCHVPSTVKLGLQRAGLRPRDLYQCRHTFASLMLQAGEDPAWVAQMMGHTTTKMLYERYHRFIQHRTRQDGSLYLKRLKG